MVVSNTLKLDTPCRDGRRRRVDIAFRCGSLVSLAPLFARSASIRDCKGYARWKHGSVVFLPRRLLASFVDMYLRAYFCVERQICSFILQRLILCYSFSPPSALLCFAQISLPDACRRAERRFSSESWDSFLVVASLLVR